MHRVGLAFRRGHELREFPRRRVPIAKFAYGSLVGVHAVAYAPQTEIRRELWRPKHDNEAITIAPGEHPVLRIGGDHCDRSSGIVAYQIASSDASDRRTVGAAMSPPQRSDR